MAEKLKKFEVPAFRDPLKPHVDMNTDPDEPPDDKLLQVGRRRDLVIRKLDTTRFPHEEDYSPTEGVVDRAQIIKKYFDELSHFGVRIPVSFVVAKDEADNDAIYAAVKRVKDRASNTEKERMEEASAWYALFLSLLSYLESKEHNQDWLVADIADESQYVYGTIDKGKRGLFLVDVDPSITKGRITLHDTAYLIKESVERAHEKWPTAGFDGLATRFDGLMAKIQAGE